MWDFITYFSNKVETKPIKPTQYNKSVTLESWSWKMILHFDWFVISRKSNAVDIKSCILCMNGCIVNCAALPNMNICLYLHEHHTGRVIRQRKPKWKCMNEISLIPSLLVVLLHSCGFSVLLIFTSCNFYENAEGSFWCLLQAFTRLPHVSFTSCSVVGLKFCVCCNVRACAVRMSS